MRPDRDRNLDRELRDLGPRVEYPPTPDLAPSVRERLEAEDGTHGTPARGPHLWWFVAAVFALLVAIPVFAWIVSTTGGSFSAGGGGMAGGAGESGGSVEPGRGGAADVAEPTQPSLAMESGASSAAGSSSSSEAACAYPAPTLEARPARGAPGDRFRVSGGHFIAGFSACDDTPPEMSAQTVPARDVRIEFWQDGRTWGLGSVEAGKNARIDATLEVPAGARPGRATVRATYTPGVGASTPPESVTETPFLVLGG